MKVIKYGEGYEPKRTICNFCMSELEFSLIDVTCQCDNLYSFTDGGYKVICNVQRRVMIGCPVCGSSIDVSADINDYDLNIISKNI